MPNNIDEAMALAAANPVVGMSGPHHASFIVNVMNHDKDLGDDGRVLTGLSKSLDMDDNLYGVDQNGRFFAKRKYDVMERKDIIECYKVNVDCTKLIESIEAELKIPYESRPVHKQSYIYEALTGKALLSEDQMEYDSLCEKVQLDKMTAALAGVTQGSLSRAHNMQQGKQDKEAGYIPDNDFPQGTENMSVPGMALESYHPMNQDLKLLKEVAETKFHVDGETMYSMNEETGYRPNPIIISDDDIYVNFDKFVNKQEHVLFITGLSGSGKSTLGQKMADKYDAYYVETDIIAFKLMKNNTISWDHIQENDKMLYKYMKENKLDVSFMSDISFSNYKTTEKKKWETRVNDYIKWLISGQKDRVIIGGGNVGVFLQDHPQYTYLPTIFKGTSLLKSIWRRVNRSKRSILDQLKSFPITFKQYQDMWKEMKNSRMNVMSGNEWEFVKESKVTSLEDRETMHSMTLAESYSQSDLQAANQICKTLSSKEKKDVDSLTSKNLEYLKVDYQGNVPTGFISIKSDKSNPKYKDSYVILAVSPQFRKQGIASKLVGQAISWFNKSEFNDLFWPCDIHNEASNNLAKSSGFKFAWTKDGGKSNVYRLHKKNVTLEDGMMSLLGIKK